MIKCILRGFTINENGNFVLYSGFNNGKAIVTPEKGVGFEIIPTSIARVMLRTSVCPLRAPDSELSKRHNRQVRYYKELKNG